MFLRLRVGRGDVGRSCGHAAVLRLLILVAIRLGGTRGTSFTLENDSLVEQD